MTENKTRQQIKPFKSKPLIFQYLSRGIENAQTSKQLALRLHKPQRRIVAMINHDRGYGYPICASQYGYYLPKNKRDMQMTIDSLQNRSQETWKPSQALQRTLDDAIKQGKDLVQYALEQMNKNKDDDQEQ